MMLRGQSAEVTAAWIYLALTAVVIVFHTAVILGAPFGHLTMGGRWNGALPPIGRMMSAMSLLLLALMAFVVMARAGLVRARLPGWAIWVVVALHGLGVVQHIMTPSAAERALWLPQILVALICALVVALRAKP